MRFDGRLNRGLAAAIRPATGPVLLLLFLGLVLAPSCGSDGADDSSSVTVPGDTASDETTDAEAGGPPCDDDREWTSGGDAITDFVDFVQLEGGQFLHAVQNVGVLDEPDLGSVVAEVCLELSEVTFTGPFDIEPGDAVYLAPGTELREIAGSDPSLRVGTLVDGRVLIYEVWNRPDAVVGAQLIDLGLNIDEVTVGADGGPGLNVLASVTEADTLDTLVAAVRTAPVSRPSGSDSFGDATYVVEFHRSDGTTSRRRYRAASGELEPGIILPEEARLLLLGLIAEANPEVAASETTTATGTTTATTGTSPDGNDDVALIPTPVNEAEPTLRFDFGAIVGTSIEGDSSWIQFDRYQLGDGVNGPDLTDEVRIEGATDLVWANENSRFRWYPLAPGVEVLELEADWFNLLCDGEPADVEFVATSLNRLLALDARLVSLTFVNQEVVRIRDQRSC